MAPIATADIQQDLPVVNTKSTTTPSGEAASNSTIPSNHKTGLAALTHGNTSTAPSTHLQIPTFVTFTEHRTHLLNHLAAAFRHWSSSGYVFGISGHISVRDPEYHNTFWTNPLGKHFGLLKASDMILLSLDGDVVHKSNVAETQRDGYAAHPANAAGFLIHAAVHKRRPDVHAACHAHTKHGRAWSVFGKPVQMLSQDACKFHGKRQSVYNAYGGVVLGAEEGERIADALGQEGTGCILRNHGLLTVGETVDAAAWRFDVLEAACMDQLAVEAADPDGTKRVLVDEVEAEYNAEVEGGEEICYAEFQATFQWEEAKDKSFMD